MGKISGTDIYLQVNTGTEESPVWTKVGGQKDATFERGMNTMEITDKDSEGYEEHLPANRNWSLSCESFIIEDDAGFLEIEGSYDDRSQLLYRIITPGAIYQGKATVESFSMAGPDAEAGVVSLSLKGTGALAKT